MKHICELNDKIILGLDGLSSKAPRMTARAIVKNHDGLYAVMYADKFKLHSLPGGGVEDGEDVLAALHREVYEETGCVCDKIQELGIVTENHIIFFLVVLDAYTLPHNKVLCPVNIGCILAKFRVHILHSWHLLSVAFPKILIIDIMVSASLPDSVLWIFLSNASSSLVK